MKKYITVAGIGTDFESAVNTMIEKGYEPLGGVSVLPHHSFQDVRGVMVQAMIKAQPLVLMCPECNCQMEEYKYGVFSCNNEDCGCEVKAQQ